MLTTDTHTDATEAAYRRGFHQAIALLARDLRETDPEQADQLTAYAGELLLWRHCFGSYSRTRGKLCPPPEFQELPAGFKRSRGQAWNKSGSLRRCD